MKRFFILIFVLVLSFLYMLDLHAFQFESYKWGESYIEILNQVKAERKEIISDENDKIIYKDMIFGQSCKITLNFIPKLLQLSFIEVIWDGTENGLEVRDILIGKYGEPHQERDFLDNYVWFSDTSSQKIELDYSSGSIKLTYYGGEYYTEYQKALSRSYSKDLDKV